MISHWYDEREGSQGSPRGTPSKLKLRQFERWDKRGEMGGDGRRWAVATVAYGVTAWSEMWLVCGRLAGYQFIDILGITSSSLKD